MTNDSPEIKAEVQTALHKAASAALEALKDVQLVYLAEYSEENAYAEEIEALTKALAVPEQDPDLTVLTIKRLLDTISYIISIAESGMGRPIQGHESAEDFVLSYIQKLEAWTPGLDCGTYTSEGQASLVPHSIGTYTGDGQTDRILPKIFPGHGAQILKEVATEWSPFIAVEALPFLSIDGMSLPVDTIKQISEWGVQCMEAGKRSAQSEQEPFGYVIGLGPERYAFSTKPPEGGVFGTLTRVYKSPPLHEWVSLTDEEAWEEWVTAVDASKTSDRLLAFIYFRAIDAKLMEKNT